uniref:Uncharacterized protein n=1 Tax=viral metagenome TaxID=1070528 RepID=A0A6M3XZ86_9ZZZZ
MVKKRVSVESVRNSPDQVQLLVVAWDTRGVEGKEQEVPLGEKALTFPGGTRPADMLDAIREAGEQIEETAARAKEIRAELNRLLQEKPKKSEESSPPSSPERRRHEMAA